MAITNPGASDKLNAAIAKGLSIAFNKTGGTMKGGSTYHSFWKATGSPVAGNNPGVPSIPTRQTPGAIPLSVFGADTGYLATFSGFPSINGTLFLGDRLWHNSGLSANVTTLQPITNLPINRDIAQSNLLFIEHYAASGATASNVTINYNNLANQPKTVTTPIAVTSQPGQMQWVPINDSGILTPTSVQLSAATGAAGDFGLTIVNPIEMLSFLSNTAGARLGVYETALPIINPEACLFFYWGAISTASVQLTGKLVIGLG